MRRIEWHGISLLVNGPAYRSLAPLAPHSRFDDDASSCGTRGCAWRVPHSLRGVRGYTHCPGCGALLPMSWREASAAP